MAGVVWMDNNVLPAATFQQFLEVTDGFGNAAVMDAFFAMDDSRHSQSLPFKEQISKKKNLLLPRRF
jgi:hypothetical protein